MEVILRQTIAKLGRTGEVVSVKDGYARNYLLPQGLAYPATEGNKRRIESEARRHAEQLASDKAGSETVAQQLQDVELRFTAKAGEGDKLFGSITSADIAGQLQERGYSVDKRMVELPEPLKMIGIYPVAIRLHPDVRAEVRVLVAKEE